MAVLAEDPGLRRQVDWGEVTRVGSGLGRGRKGLELGNFEVPGRGEEMLRENGGQSGARATGVFEN